MFVCSYIRLCVGGGIHNAGTCVCMCAYILYVCLFMYGRVYACVHIYVCLYVCVGGGT